MMDPNGDGEDTKNVLNGPILTYPDINESLGVKLYRALSGASQDNEILTETETQRRFTVGELRSASVSFATSLRNIGIKIGDVVAIVGENSIDLTIASIGTILMGGIMAPLDSTYKTYEFQHLFKVIGPTIIICDSNKISEIQDARQKLNLDAPIIAIGKDQCFAHLLFASEFDISTGQAYSCNESDTHEQRRSTNSANVMNLSSFLNQYIPDFTPSSCIDHKKDVIAIVSSSGTTGLPKGVELTHAAFAYQLETIGCMIHSLTVLHTSYSHWISSVLLTVVSTFYGAHRVLVKEADPLQVIQAIENYRVQIAILAPSLLTATANHPALEIHDVSSLKFIVTGGSPLLKATAARTKEVFNDITIIQGYGTSEIGGLVTQTKTNQDVLSIGSLMHNMKVKIRDLITGKALGANEDGEILCQSPAVMRGYRNNEKATKEAIDEQGWYHTGDIGRYTDEEVLYITGRAKELLKVDNHQISPVEIEDVIATIPGVQDVLVLGITDGENSLPMALVVKKEDSTLRQEDVVQVVKDNLSEFKHLRAGAHFVDCIPRTSTGKPLRRIAQTTADALWKRFPQ